MFNYLNCQLITIILLKHLNELNAVWEDQIINRRVFELEEEHDQTSECRELGDEYSKLFDRMRDSDDKEQWKEALFEFDSVVGSRLFETEKFFYLAGMNDVMQIFNITQKGVGDIDSRRNQGD
jgi:hypothetical protein